jgi:hypothetical protein
MAILANSYENPRPRIVTGLWRNNARGTLQSSRMKNRR